MPEAIPPEATQARQVLPWSQEAPKPVSDSARRCILESRRCCFKGKTGASWNQEAIPPEGAFLGSRQVRFMVKKPELDLFLLEQHWCPSARKY